MPKRLEIMLYGVIGDWWDDLDAMSVVPRILASDADEILLRINSPGGFVTEGLAIFNTLKQHSARVIAQVDGLAASMASYIAMAADEIIMPENALMMIHNPHGVAIGESADMRKEADILDLMRDAMARTYSERAGIPVPEILNIMEAETWFDGVQAVESGFADKTESAVEEGDVVAQAVFPHIAKLSNMPDRLKAAAIANTKKRAAESALRNPESITMPKENTPQGSAETKPNKNTQADPVNPVNPTPDNSQASAVAQPDESALTAARAEGAQAERARVSGIRSAVRTAQLSDEFADELISGNVTLAEAREKIINKWAEEREAMPNGSSHVRVETSDANNIGRRTAIASALLHRHDPAANKMTDDAREYRGMTLMDIAREVAEASGHKTRGLPKREVAALALHSTDDFPLILSNVANKTLRDAYESAPRTFLEIARRVSASDFKDIHRVSLGDAPALEKVNEQGEFTRGTLGEGQEKYRLSTYGKVIGVTRQTIINDDLDAFTRIPMLFGRAAADLESDVFWSLFLSNPTMSDNTALFHADHKNLMTANKTAPDVTSIGATREKMRKQKNTQGRPMNLRPEFILAPVALETKVDQLLTQVTPTKSSDVTPSSIRSLRPIFEPRMDDVSEKAWYLQASPAAIDTMEYAYLDDESVFIETRNGFDVDGVEIKARHDFGCGVIDWRGYVKNPGE